MSERPLVSVCMPAYNAERWIGEAIESVLGQTHSDFELVISDNASTDATAETARLYHDPRIRIETAAKLISPVSNHNRSVALSTGEFVKFLHADDMLLPTCLEEMVALALGDPRIGLVFAPREVLLEDPESETNLGWSQTYARLHERFTQLAPINEGSVLFREMLDAGIDGNWIGEPSAVLASRACLARVGLFSPRLHQIADLDLWLRIMLSHCVGYIPHALSVYRHHSQSVTAMNARLGRDWLDRLWLLEGLVSEPSLNPEERASVARLRNAALRRASRSQVRRLVHGRFSPSVDLISYSAYRARALAGKARPLHDSLETEPARGQAIPRESPASAYPAPK
jgi:glycosyltransferase involved in cell wall biosynthesis